MTNDRIRVGVFGVGSLGQHHARLYAQMDEAELAGIYDVDRARAEDVAQRVGTDVYDSMESLAEDTDAASVAVPTDKHFGISTRLMERGLHLLVEKPIAATMVEAEGMVRFAEDRNLILQVGHVERFNPVMQFLEDNLSRPRFIEAIRLAQYPPARESGVPRGTEVSVVLDLMVHDLDIILHLVRSPVTAIHAVGVPVLSSTEDIANVRLGFANGCVANVTASRISQERMRKIRVFQEDTYVSLDYMEQSGELHRKEDHGITMLPVPIEKGEPLAAELAAFVHSVTHHSEPVVSGRHGTDVLRLAVQISQCIREQPS